jgi:tRNA/tmRNA/rRNA uracil-C5-methylase (TrmA/RlmC/RlmD family)
MNAALQVTRQLVLGGATELWDVRGHTGFWRHLVLREGDGEVLVGVYTTTPQNDAQSAEVATLADALLSQGVKGVVWCVNDGVADVATGAERAVFGRPWVGQTLGGITFRLSLHSFFQTSAEGAQVLYDTIREAVGDAGGVLLDLYCGVGSIGLFLHDRFDRIVGVEQVEAAVVDARANAERNNVEARFVAAKVEDALAELSTVTERRTLIVDPPRVGLHPKVARALASADAEALIYVACRPGALGRDGAVLAEAGWRLTDLWTVDLFPQTPHIELVGRFVR